MIEHIVGFDANGNVTVDESRGVTEVDYNESNQATDIWLSDGWRVVTSYGPDGSKLRSALASPEGWGVTVRKYLGNLVIEDDRVIQQLFPGGYFDAEGNACYYLTDYQDNVTGVIDSNAKIVQETGYYPYGEPWLEPEGDNPYLYGGKERMALGGVRYSDFGPRLLSTASGYWGSPDPLLEKTPDISPYINCAANPVRFSDLSGLSPVYSLNGDSLGCTKEGHTGQILIYMGDEDISFSKYNVSELKNVCGGDVRDFDEAINEGLLMNGAHSRIITSVLSHFEGLNVFGHKFSLSKLDGGKIWYAPEKKDSNWDTSFSPSDAVKPKISYTGGKDYEATVENIASSAIIHEWYSHGVQHVHDKFNNHSRAYFNVLYVNPLAWKTTKKYKDFNRRRFNEYSKIEIANYHK